MATNAIIDGTNIDTSVFAYTAIKPNPTGGKVVNLLNKHFKESLTLSTPLMLTWGAQEGQDQNKNPTGKFSMSLQFPTADYTNPDLEAFLASIHTLEDKIKADALTYSKEWFGKSITSADVMEEKFNVMLRHPKKEKGGLEMDFDKPPTLTVKIPCWKGVWQPEIYDEDGNPLFLKGNKSSSPLDFLKPKTHVICLLQCGGLWFVNGKVSITWNLKQAIVQKPKTSSIVEGTCFLKPKTVEIEKLRAQPAAEVDIDPEGAAIVDDDADDQFEMTLPAPVPVPVPVVEPVQESVVAEPVVATKKKIISKKVTA